MFYVGAAVAPAPFGPGMVLSHESWETGPVTVLALGKQAQKSRVTWPPYSSDTHHNPRPVPALEVGL